MQTLLQLVSALTDKLRTLVVSKNVQTEASKKLYETALSFIGQDASPKDIANDILGCAESVNAVAEKAWGEPIGGEISTYRMYYVLLNHKKFIPVDNYLAGDIIISPTGVGGGKNGITNGHVGICGQNGKIMSSVSRTGKWEQNYDTWSWRYRYVTMGGYKMLYFRRLY